MTERNAIAVVGSGLMGPGIAACSALAGHRTRLFGRSTEKAMAGLEKAKWHVQQLVESGVAEKDQGQEAYHLLQACVDYERDLADVFWIIESITESIAIKQDFFELMDSVVPPEVFITSNTSGLRITDISRGMKYPQRAATTHFWFPAHLIPLVEVVMGERTEERIALQVKEVLLKWHKAPVIVRKDLPGQLANRIQQAMIREAISIVHMGLATPEDVDTAVKMGFGMRLPVWGPFEHIEAVGLDLALSVQESVLPGICNDAKPSPYLKELVDAGRLGYKTGAGIYDWKTKDMKALAEKRDRFLAQALKII